MSSGLYLTSTEARAGKAAVALGVMELLARQVDDLAVFRPVIARGDRPDPLLELLIDRYGLQVDPADAYVFSYEQASAMVGAGDTDRLVAQVAERHAQLRAHHEFVLIVGTDYVGPSPATELELNATLAANLGAPVLTVVSGYGKTPAAIGAAADSAAHVLGEHGCSLVATVVNRVDPNLVLQVRHERRSRDGEAPPTYVIPEVPVLSALTVDEVIAALDGTLLTGEASSTEREIDGYVVGSAHLERALDVLRDGNLIVAAGDRDDLVVAASAAAGNPALPTPSGVVLTLGLRPGPRVQALIENSRVPVVSVAPDTYATLHVLEALSGEIRPGSRRKIAAALGEFAAAVDAEELSARIKVAHTDVVTPLMFSAALLERARADRRHIVLPEGDDERVLRAAEELVHQGVVELTVLGDPAVLQARLDELGLDLGSTRLLDPYTSPLRAEFAETYAKLRAHKGVSADLAWDTMGDGSYFGTMMVQTGLVDGMVSGAAHTTAHTIRPALEIIRTSPDVSLVSSSFLMCLPDRVLVFADCAVNPNPDAEQLADIALSTTATAAAFGVEPRVAMVSYSTGSSGTGADVEKVRRATELVAARRPDLPLAGPIQYDAAVDPSVGAAKMPGNPVAGRATVLIFPDLNTGNTTYKAVQRAADAIAIGPVLQGLRKPVNDLSRGCTVPDIINTVAITAVQAQAAAR